MTQSDNSILIDWKKNYAFIMTKICKQQMLENPKPPQFVEFAMMR